MGAHYKRQLQELQTLLDSKLRQFTVLEREHETLQTKEKALVQAIQGFEGPLALTRHALSSAGAPPPPPPAAAAAAGAVTAAAAGGSPSSSGSADSLVSQSMCCPDLQQQQHQQQQQPLQGRSDSSSSSSSASTVPRVPYTQPQSLLQHLDTRETVVQSVLQQLGGCGGGGAAAYKRLYTSQLLQKSMADPVRTAGFLATPASERLTYVAEACTRIALLLGKYDADVRMGGPRISSNSSNGSGCGGSCGGGSNGGCIGGCGGGSNGGCNGSSSAVRPGMTFRQALDTEIDELFERKVVSGLWDPPSVHLQCYMVNLQTRELEAYPQGWWEHVAQAVHPTKQQLAAIKLVWGRVKQQAAALAAEFEQLQQQLQQSHMQRRADNLDFERVVQQLSAMDLEKYAGPRATQQQQQQQQQQLNGSARCLQQLHDQWRSESLPPPQQPSEQQQQQQQLSEQQQQQQEQQQQQQGSSSGVLGSGVGCFFAPGAGAFSGQLQEAEEVLLQEGEKERDLQRQMAAVTNKIRVLFYCLLLQLVNTLTKKQLAVMMVQSHPFMFDSLCVCETMEQLGWLD